MGILTGKMIRYVVLIKEQKSLVRHLIVEFVISGDYPYVTLGRKEHRDKLNVFIESQNVLHVSCIIFLFSFFQ